MQSIETRPSILLERGIQYLPVGGRYNSPYPSDDGKGSDHSQEPFLLGTPSFSYCILCWDAKCPEVVAHLTLHRPGCRTLSGNSTCGTYVGNLLVPAALLLRLITTPERSRLPIERGVTTDQTIIGSDL